MKTPSDMAEAFSPETLNLVGEALEVAWDFVKHSSGSGHSDEATVREILARHIVMCARLGESRKIALANRAIARFRAQMNETAGRSWLPL